MGWITLLFQVGLRINKLKITENELVTIIKEERAKINSDNVKIGWNNNNSLILKKPSLIKDLDIDRVLLGH